MGFVHHGTRVKFTKAMCRALRSTYESRHWTLARPINGRGERKVSEFIRGGSGGNYRYEGREFSDWTQEEGLVLLRLVNLTIKLAEDPSTKTYPKQTYEGLQARMAAVAQIIKLNAVDLLGAIPT